MITELKIISSASDEVLDRASLEYVFKSEKIEFSTEDQIHLQKRILHRLRRQPGSSGPRRGGGGFRV